MAVKIGINGFGRIGRYMTRILANDPNIIVTAINARAENQDLARLLKYDSIHRTFAGDVDSDQAGLIVNGRHIAITREEPDTWRWGEMGVDIVIESTGRFTERSQAARHLACGAKKVLISAPGKQADATIVMGVNQDIYDPGNHHVVSAASCTTNCLAPVAKVLNDSFGLNRGLMTTIHSYTMSQRILDGSHKDPRRARAAAASMIPTTTGAARAVALVIPELAGKLDGMAVRVPTPNVSLVDFTCELDRRATSNEINAVFKECANDSMGYSDDPLVSIDYLGSTHGGVVDSLCTTVMDNTLAKVIVWYDNEAGFTNQLVRLAKLMAADFN
ncbi:type I glyceraldehyde-3-phosphate dehydrogenase [Fundidesulfovibrio putealis]|uniref:type I glyceraldehyde-3-phosphate dehydrogenase n=1 Tax=Fundidesulfovibrio putealis TaxID=270496 RepID=UPI00040719D3|nr:type I glyceraldehyde-3-phosphate dehydrogenase [Fundidesulfovibrio putealis]